MSIKIETETGTAELYPDGSMLLNNSGYSQLLNPQQVQQVWNGEKKLSPCDFDRVEMEKDGFSEKEIMEYGPRWDGEYWDFGDEQHVIPLELDFELEP